MTLGEEGDYYKRVYVAPLLVFTCKESKRTGRGPNVKIVWKCKNEREREQVPRFWQARARLGLSLT